MQSDHDIGPGAPAGCDGGQDRCGCRPSRRGVLWSAAVAAVGVLSARDAVAGPFTADDFDNLIPADKKFSKTWLDSLTARGEPETYTGDELRFIGMPVGGICTGTLYLSGDGRLWLWNVFNREVTGIDPKTVEYAGRPVTAQEGSAYIAPPQPFGPVAQGFSLGILREGGGPQIVSLDHKGFSDVRFTGQYPVATVRYRDRSVPVTATLEAFSPFIPLDAEDSGLPATVMHFTLTNTSRDPVAVTLAGMLENAVCPYDREVKGVRSNQIVADENLTLLECRAEDGGEPPPATAPAARETLRPDMLFEDWTADSYRGWTVEGTAFGKGPVAKSDVPTYQGDLGGPGARVVNSHSSAPGNSVGERDGAKGKLTSMPFAVERDYLHLWVGGGRHAGRTCVNLRVDGDLVASLTGDNANRMTLKGFDLRPYAAKQAVLEIVDAETGAWGNIGVGRITFSDRRPDGPVAGPIRLQSLAGFGTMALALLGAPAEHRRTETDVTGFGRGTEDLAKRKLRESLYGAVGRTLRLAPGESKSVSFVITWHFPNLSIEGGRLRGRHYASRFTDATAVARYVAKNFDRLANTTRLWRDTWYDSTLPHWFLNRTFANTSTLATTTCYRLGDGRFWAWEGIGCCAGTCTHVWHYAQAMGRIFPSLERDLRERVDFGLAMNQTTGMIRFRGEFNNMFAEDGQCGIVLRSYREHQMSADDGFLRRNWDHIKLAMRYIIGFDRNGDGVPRGPMHNTLDADWYGVVPWLVGMYHAALRAAEEMARELGDVTFADECRKIFERGAKNLDEMTFKEKYGYYVHLGDPKHLTEVGSYDGCHIDQVLGQSWAWQVGLGNVMDVAHRRAALRALWRYSLTPDVGPYRRVNKPGRWYAMPGDGGMLMVTFPFGRPASVTGPGAWSAMYFNECMSGFEWQVAGHMIWEGMVQEGLAVARLIHDRYHARLRNPYNEIECSDHYARAMASYGVFLAACGFEYHGPRGHIGFLPKLTPEGFRCPFTAAEGWGTYDQRISGARLTARLEVKHGSLRLRTFACRPGSGGKDEAVTVRMGDRAIAATATTSAERTLVTLGDAVTLKAGEAIEIVVG